MSLGRCSILVEMLAVRERAGVMILAKRRFAYCGLAAMLGAVLAVCLTAGASSTAWADDIESSSAEPAVDAFDQSAEIDVLEDASTAEASASADDAVVPVDDPENSDKIDSGTQTPSGGSDDDSEEDAPAPLKGFVREGDTIRYYYDDGSLAKDAWVTYAGHRYYFNASGVAVRWGQWIGSGSEKAFYYFNKDCQMVTGWITWNADKSKSYFGSNGKALKGLQKIGGATY